MYLKADSVTVESDEMGFEIHIKGDEGPLAPLVINIQGIDLDAFYDQVKGRIGPYLQEADAARQAVASGISREEFLRDENAHERMTGQHVFECDPDESGGYEPSDPKHENFHSVHADIWDARAGK